MRKKGKARSFLFGRLVVSAKVLQQINPFTVYWALWRHACRKAVELCPVNHPTANLSCWARCRYASAHRDRHGTAFWIVTEPDLSKTTIKLAGER